MKDRLKIGNFTQVEYYPVTLKKTLQIKFRKATGCIGASDKDTGTITGFSNTL